MAELSYRRHRFPPVVIPHAVWLYLRFTLSYRDVEDLLAERGLDISYESVRSWVLKFGPVPVNRLRSHIVIGPDVVEDESQQYGKNYAELQENCMSDLMIAKKPVMANDPVQQHAYGSCYKPGPEDQCAKFSIRHPGCPAAIPDSNKTEPKRAS